MEKVTQRFADYFAICGLDFNSGLEADKFSGDNLHCSPLERAYKCKILGHYPENVTWNPFHSSAVCLLCLPNGLRFRTQKHSVTQAPVFHTFVITREDGKRYYGFSLVFYEEVRNRDICSAMQTLQAMYITELSSGQIVSRSKQIQQQSTGQSRSLPRHFKLTTHNPGGAPGYYDISKDRLYVSKSIAIICQCPYVQAAKLFLENIYKCFKSVHKRQTTSNGSGGNGAGLSLESYVYNLLYEVQVPASGQSIVIYLPPCDPSLPPVSVVLQNPSPPLELPQFDFAMRFMFTWLGVDIVTQLFTCLLLENQILLRSNDCQRLMVVAECITTLLFPFVWPHVYVPILPASLHNFLDAPVPFVMGLHACSENIKVASEASLCYVDIDKPKVQLPEEMVAFPHEESFIAELCSALDKHGVNVDNSEITRSRHDLMSTSCTLPGRPHSLNRNRKSSLHDTLDCDRPPSPPGSARTEALQRIADIVRRTGVALDKTDSFQPVDQYGDDLRFNNSVREIFLNRFVHIFQSYENFVIFPNQGQGQEDWLNNRDSMQNFDKSSFLSDQPEQHRPFLSRFLETQMFATLVDNKIVTLWNEPDVNLQILDTRIRLLRQRYGGENLMRSLSYEPCISAPESQKFLDRRLKNPDFEAPMPQEILNKRQSYSSRHFPLLDKEILNKTPIVNKGSIPRANSTNTSRTILERIQALKSATSTSDMSPALIAQTNWSFVEMLLKDCKSKTKRMLLAKLGAEGVTLGNGGPDTPGAVEESTLVVSLCDFLERVWSHGLQRKSGKSALWSHLMLYQEQQQVFVPSKQDSQYLSPVEMSSLALRKETWKQSGRTDNRNVKTEQLQPLPESLIFDLANIQSMSDVITHIGRAKAWVRLALERKHLSRHLKVLLSDHSLLRVLYKRSAFLRCEEEREQFLYHLFSLSVVDYYCFTSTYSNTTMPYKVVIYPSRKATTTSANAWVILSGTLGETQPVPVPKSSLHFEFRHKNLGILTTMRIGHDNTGLYAKWMIEHVLVRNEITGHTYKFPCGRWLGRGVDDGSTERLLVATLLPKQLDGEEIGQMCQTPPRCRSPGIPRQELRSSDIQHMLGDCVNSIVKWHHKRSNEKNTTTLTALLCGERGLVQCLEQVFLFGFRSSRLFGRNLYLWDYFVRVKDYFELQLVKDSCLSEINSDMSSRSSTMDRNHVETAAVWRCYCHLVDEILSGSNSLGKDGKYQLFICLSVREHLLHRMLVPMSASRPTLDMYEETSFLRNRGLLTFLRQILLPLDDLDVVLENSVTQGLSSPSCM